MEHLSDSVLLAYRDEQLTPNQAARVQKHLEACSACQARFAQAHTRGAWLQARFETLGDLPATNRAPSLYRARLENRLPSIKKEQNTMFRFFKKHRGLSVLATLLVVLTISLAIPSVRALAAQVLALFRVQDTTVLPVNIAGLPDNFAAAAENVFYLVAEDTQYTTSGQVEFVGTAERASQSAGFTVRLPDLPYSPSQITVEPQVDGTFTLNAAKAQAILAEIERGDILIPSEWDGAQVTFSVPRAVIAEYTGCGEGGSGQMCMMFIQIPSPTVNAPEHVDVRQVGEIFLQVSGMSAEEARAYSSQIDWLSTLVIPVPEPDARYESVTVDGVKGTLVLANAESQEHALIWVKDNIIYAISASGDPSLTLNAANSLH